MVRLQFDGKQYKLTLPKKLLEAIGWKKGDNVVIEVDAAGSIVLRNAGKLEGAADKAGDGGDGRDEERIEYAR